MKQAPQNSSKYQISAKSVKGFGSCEHLNFRPTNLARIQVMTSSLRNSSDVPNFWLPLCKIQKALRRCQIS